MGYRAVLVVWVFLTVVLGRLTVEIVGALT